MKITLCYYPDKFGISTRINRREAGRDNKDVMNSNPMSNQSNIFQVYKLFTLRLGRGLKHRYEADNGIKKFFQLCLQHSLKMSNANQTKILQKMLKHQKEKTPGKNIEKVMASSAVRIALENRLVWKNE